VLGLESTRWAELKHAYGGTADIPYLLRKLESLPSSDGENEPWFTLWSSLAHQGDVYSASFAAVPHVVRVLETAPDKADATYFQFPAWIEVCRKKTSTEVPSDLSEAYFAALKRLPSLVAQAAVREWDAGFLQCALLAIAAVKGEPEVAEAAQELSPDVASEFLVWFYER
jgi:hypothetical protein